MSKKPTPKPNGSNRKASVPASGDATPEPVAAEAAAAPEAPPAETAAPVDTPEPAAPPAEELAVTSAATSGPAAAPAFEPEPPPPDLRARVAASPASYGIAAVVGAVVAIAVLAGVVYATLPLWASRLELAAPAAEELADVARLRARLDALEAQGPPADRSEAPLQELEARRNELSGEVQQLMARMSQLEEGIRSVARIVEATSAPGAAAEARDSLRDLSERLSKVEQSQAAPEALAPPADRAEKRDADEARLDDLRARNDHLASALSTLSEKVGSMEQARADQGNVERRRRLLTSIERLRESLRSPGPFAAELAALKDAAVDNRDILGIVAAVEPYADAGIPSLAVVQRRFDAAALRIAQAARPAQGDGLVERVVHRLSSLVVIRKLDPDAGDDLDQILGRAEASVAEGNLIEAVKALGELGGPAAAVAKPWLADAEARIAAERASALLHVQVVSLIGAGGD